MPVMESVTLENFRCFREKQTVNLAPLTLLVGENSTGKTSLLALIQALSQFVFEGRQPSFKDPPFDLGSFDEIVHNRGAQTNPTASFVAGMSSPINLQSADGQSDLPDSTIAAFEVAFQRPLRGTVPLAVRQHIVAGESSVEEKLDYEDDSYEATLTTRRGSWTIHVAESAFGAFGLILKIFKVFNSLPQQIESDVRFPARRIGNSPEMEFEDVRQLLQLDFQRAARFAHNGPYEGTLPLAPVRTRPRRSYDPASLILDAEGNHVPSYLADLEHREDMVWPALKDSIESFGKKSGLFNEISVLRHEGDSSSSIQLQFHIRDEGKESPFRNMPDVGYGVSQVLPVITELLRPDGAALFLLQQPEVHLHPSAQAALGSLFCKVAADGRQLIVETHSDHLIDRIRMDVRDGKTSLNPEDVKILYFERSELDVKIHEITYDNMGNLENVPDGYRRFFMEEVDRSIWGPQ